LLAGVGLYGVLDYSVLQRRREIGIRMAIGAQAGDIARLVTVEVFSMVLAGALAGLALGMASVRYIESLLYQVKATDLGLLALPSLAILAAALLAAAGGDPRGAHRSGGHAAPPILSSTARPTPDCAISGEWPDSNPIGRWLRTS
jgi:predicted lysophospholipase L1 biosynthesis ABC-type transport system permease subunit